MKLPFSHRAQPFDLPIKGLRPQDDDQVPVVPFVPYRCPFCLGLHVKTHKVRGRLRQHHCQSCCRRYRSLEYPPSAVDTRAAPVDGPHGGPSEQSR